MAIDLQSLSAKELDTLINKAKARKTKLKKRKPLATVRARLKAAATAEGYTIAELFGTTAGSAAPAATTRKAGKSAKAGRTLGKVAPKYRNPESPAETWTGRGMKPRWLAAQLAAGKTADEFLIAKE